MDPSNGREPTPAVGFLRDLLEELFGQSEVIGRPSLLLFQPKEAHQLFFQAFLLFFHDFFLRFPPMV